MTWTDRDLDAIDFRIAAIRFEEIARQLIGEAAELQPTDPHFLGGTGPRFANAETSLQSAATRLRVGARALQAIAAVCRSRAQSSASRV